jgi:hypothetical protein
MSMLKQTNPVRIPVTVVFTGYLQLLFNLFSIGLVMTISLKVLFIFNADVRKHINIQKYDLIESKIRCSQEFIVNDCDIRPVPALMNTCGEWRKCMDQSTNDMMLTSESASVMAQILNSFFDKLSNRTIVWGGSIWVSIIVTINAMLNFAKRN